MVRYSTDDYMNMIRCYEYSNYNSVAAANRYRELYPNSSGPSPNTILRTANRLSTTGSVEMRREGIMNVSELADMREDAVMEWIEQFPESSLRQMVVELSIPKSTIYLILKRAGMHPFKKTRVQELLEIDYPQHLRFCQLVLNQERENEGFVNKILFTDECTFKRVGCYSYRNIHHWSLENPHVIDNGRSVQSRFKINAWAGMIGDKIIGPKELMETLTGESYLSFLQNDLPDLLQQQDVDLSDDSLWYMQDGAPAHTTLIVRDHLHAQFPGRFLGKYGSVMWPPRLPDLNPLDFFLWGYIKNIVYKTPVDDENDLMNRINFAIQTVTHEMAEKAIKNFLKRCKVCVQNNGGHFEHDMRLYEDDEDINRPDNDQNQNQPDNDQPDNDQSDNDESDNDQSDNDQSDDDERRDPTWREQN